MSKSKNNLMLFVIITIVIIGIGVGVYFLVKSKEPYDLCPGQVPSSITTKHECLTAARKLSGDNSLTLNDDDEQDNNYPKGCYKYDNKRNFSGYYFNNPPNGTGTSNAVNTTSICKPEYIQTEKSNFQIVKKVNKNGEILYNIGDCTDPSKCLSFDNLRLFLTNYYKYTTADPQFASCADKVLKNETISQTCRDKLKSWNTYAERMESQLQDESKVNKVLKGDSSKGFVKALQKYTKSVDNYNGEFGTRLKTLFENILKTSQKVGEFNQVINGKQISQLENYNKYLGEIKTCWEKANEDAENVNYFPTTQKQDEQKEFLKRNVVRIFNSLRNDGTLGELYSEDIIERLKSDIEGITGVSFDTYEGFGFDYDTDGNLREYDRGGDGNCYLITACTKAKLLSIGQVYQLRKVMLEAFKDESNHKFFHFYYSNFREIADFLESRKQLNEIVPGMLEVVELSKRGEMQSAFGKYISTVRKAYQMCKDMKLDVSGIEQEWDSLEDFKLGGLPEPNTLFVEEPFKKALRYFETVC